MFSVQTLKSRGFTLIELMVVMTVIAILSTIALFGIGKAQAAARDVQRQQTMNGYRATLERFYGDYQGYPYYTGDPNNRFYYLTYILTGNNPGSQFNPAPGAYLSGGWGNVPTDPSTKGWVCAGGTNGSGCTPGSGIWYQYDVSGCNGSLCQGYTLTLTKEAGGKSIFSSPQ